MQVANQREIIVEVQKTNNIKVNNNNNNTKEFSKFTYIGITVATLIMMVVLSILLLL